MDKDFDIIVVGSGHNGLVAANYLGAANYSVLLTERRPIIGGACITEELFPGYKFSACSYICYLLQDKIIDDLQLRDHGFDIYPINPSRFQPFPNGSRILLWDDVQKTQEEIACHSKRDANRFPEWLTFWEKAANIIGPYYLSNPPTVKQIICSLTDSEKDFFQRLLTVSMSDLLCEYFESETMRAGFSLAQDVGDLSTPGSAWCYAHVKSSVLHRPENVGLVHGGMGGITQAMAKSARSRGVSIETSTEVSRILVEDSRAIGVELVDGTQYRSRVVVSNLDPKRTFLKLLPAEAINANFTDRINSLKTKAAYLKFHAALSDIPDFSAYFDNDFDSRYLAEIKICPSMEYFQNSWKDACDGRPSRTPVMEVQIPSVYDPTMAPEGHHVMSIWVSYAPVTLAQSTWDEQRNKVGEHLIDELATYAPNLRDILVDWSLFTPLDLERRVGLTDGNIRHLDIIPSQFFANRPLANWAHYRTPIDGLYLCGAGTHPGGEVTGAPGHNAAATVLQDLQ